MIAKSFKHLVMGGAMVGVLTAFGAPVFAVSLFAPGNPAILASPSFVLLAAADESAIEGAKDFIDMMTQRGLSFLENPTLSDDQRRVEFESLLNDGFDMNTIARFSLGRYWKSLSEAQQKEYLQLFETMVINAYSRRFSEYQGQKLSVISARAEGERDILVTTHILSPSGPPVAVDWRVRPKEKSYKVVDVIVAGVSMALTQRSDFSSVIQRGGGDVEVLLSHMRGVQ